MMKLLDYIKKIHKLKTDAELSRLIELAPPTISKIRSGKVNVSAETILKIHESTHLPVAQIRKLL